MAAYIALIHKEAKSNYGVSFPDFPGCITVGRTLDEARTRAVEALAFHIDGMIEDGQSIPEPSDMETIMRDRENRNAVAILVEAPTRGSRTVRVNITLSEEVLREIDAFAEEKGYTRSGLIVRAAKTLLERGAKRKPGRGKALGRV